MYSFQEERGEINFQQAYVLKIYYGKLHLGIKTIMFHMINFEVYFVWTIIPNSIVKFTFQCFNLILIISKSCRIEVLEGETKFCEWSDNSLIRNFHPCDPRA